MTKETEYHQDGSYTERYDDPSSTSVTKNSDGTVREWSRDENPVLIGPIRKTYDGDNECINVQKEEGGNCYLTTACIVSMNLSDDCQELQVLRNFRDNIMLKSEKYSRDVELYYAIAPLIVKKINSMIDAHLLWNKIYYELIAPFVKFIKSGEAILAIEHYKQYVQSLTKLIDEK